jgi:ABC-type branched-subunit amino acid transport system ATPase component
MAAAALARRFRFQGGGDVTGAPLLRLEEVTRRFGGVVAVDGVSFGVAAGAVHGLIGPNGAGKTTVLNLISGLMPLSSGRILFDERRIDTLPAHRIAALGIRRTFQNIRLFPTMTALDHVIVGEHTRRRDSTLGHVLLPAVAGLAWAADRAHIVYHPAAPRRQNDMRERARSLLARVGLAERAGEQARNLSYGDQRRLEIARALAGAPRLLLLDEPAAGMPFAETRSLAGLIRAIAAEGCTVLLIEHNMDLVMEVCDRITVLDFGRVIADGAPAAVRADPAVITAYLGSEA